MNLVQMKSVVEDLRRMGLKKERIRTNLEKKVKLNPADSDAFIRLGLYYLSVEDLKECLKNFKKAVILKPGNEHLWFLQGYVYESSKFYNQALQAYYFSYRLGSQVARDKLLVFCNSSFAHKLAPEQQQIIKEFKESVC
jgi:tetratricopeptide (TPR) repeat protein